MTYNHIMNNPKAEIVSFLFHSSIYGVSFSSMMRLHLLGTRKETAGLNAPESFAF